MTIKSLHPKSWNKVRRISYDEYILSANGNFTALATSLNVFCAKSSLSLTSSRSIRQLTTFNKHSLAKHELHLS